MPAESSSATTPAAGAGIVRVVLKRPADRTIIRLERSNTAKRISRTVRIANESGIRTLDRNDICLGWVGALLDSEASTIDAVVDDDLLWCSCAITDWERAVLECFTAATVLGGGVG